MKKIGNNINKKYVIFIFLFLIPWFNGFGNNNLSAVPPSQEDISFYEINPCEVSLFNFVSNNLNSVYQDHYSFTFNNYSSIQCFGKVTGMSIVNNGFVISVGTNTLISFLLQSFFWIFLISLIKKEKEIKLEKNILHYFYIFLTAYIFTFLIYSEYRFYEDNLYLIDLKDKKSLFIVFSIIYFVVLQLIEVVLNRISNLSNIIPFIFVVNSIFNGYNFSLFMIPFVYLGIFSITQSHNLKWFNRIYLLFSSVWIFNTSKSYYLAPSKLRGFTSSLYEFNSVLAWSILGLLLINGLYYFFLSNKDNFRLNNITFSLCKSSILIFTLSLIGSNFPLLNFFNYFYLGQQRFGIKTNNPFEKNEWGETISWRGGYASAESIGEFYGIVILFIIFMYFLTKKFNTILFIGFIFSSIGLLASNNRTVIILVVTTLIIFVNKFVNFSNILKYFLIALTISLVVFLIGYQNLNYSYDFTSQQMYAEALNYGSNNISSYLNLLNNNYERGSFYSFVFSFISAIAFMLNRAEVWGLFFARYNPTYLEFIFGSGPFNFGQFYSEIQISNTRSFLLPHSSIFSLLLFIGVLGLTLLLLFLLYTLLKNYKNLNINSVILLIYLMINLAKNDTINYFPSFSFYYFLIFISLFNTDIFEKPTKNYN